MDNNDNQDQQVDTKKVKVQTTVKCPDCGKSFEVEVEMPESSETPKMTWVD